MSSKQRYRSGPQSVVTGKIQASVTAEIGDLVGLSGNYVVPASTYSDSQTGAFEAVFLGVLIEGATNGDETTDTDCVVATSGDYEFDIAPLAATTPVGTPVAPADAGSTLADQEVAPTTAAEAIGKTSRHALQGETTVTVSIRSVVMQQAYA